MPVEHDATRSDIALLKFRNPRLSKRHVQSPGDSGLACPSFESTKAGDPQDQMQSDSVNLFVERVRSISPCFTISPENATPIVEICCRWDGIPLALELAGALVNVITEGQIAARLDDRIARSRRAGRGTGQHTSLVNYLINVFPVLFICPARPVETQGLAKLCSAFIFRAG